MAFTKLWLDQLSRRGTHPGGKKGDGKAEVGVIGIMPAPMPMTRRYSAAAFPCLDDGAQPGFGILVGDLRERPCGVFEAASPGDYAGNGMVPTVNAANIADQRG
jgi:hypothetical protein